MSAGAYLAINIIQIIDKITFSIKGITKYLQRYTPPINNVKEIIKNEPELAAELEQKIKDKIAEDIEKAKEERVAKANASKPAPKPEKKITREEALAKINIMVEDDED